MQDELNLTKNKNGKGFVLSLDAIISFLILTLLITTIPQNPPQSNKELAALQQENDLLRVWSAKTTNAWEMASDLNEMLGNRAELWINEKQITFSIKTNNAIATEGIIINEELEEDKVKIVVYYE
ncbi:MAG: hypothetical protein WCI04_05460 [archaeon]